MAADAIFSKKGMDIVLLDVEGLFVLSDVFVIANRDLPSPCPDAGRPGRGETPRGEGDQTAA